MKDRGLPPIHWRAGGRGPALVLINGWSVSGLAWPRAWVAGLEREYRVIRVDNRGTGWSRFAPTPFTLDDLADDVVKVLDAERVEQATLLGLSMGGMVAQEIAVRAPERVAGLVLSGTRPPTPAFHPTVASPVAWQLLRPLGSRETLAAYFRRVWSMATAEGFAERRPDVIEELVGQIVERPTPRAMLLHQLRAVMAWGHAERLARVRAPTLVVHGEEDRFIPVENGRAIAQLIPHARHVTLPAVGHLVPHEAPERLDELLAELVAA